MQGSERLLEASGLEAAFRTKDDHYNTIDDASFELKKNEVLVIVGESGCGKNTLATTIMGLHDPNHIEITREVLYNNLNSTTFNETSCNKVRRNDIGMILRDPLPTLDPLIQIEDQTKESLMYHTKMIVQQKQTRAIELLGQVEIPNPERIGKQYPHESPGGVRQRAIITIAITHKLPILIIDEPATALDVTTQVQVLDLLRDLQKETGSGIILIIHDLGVTAKMADHVAVMYTGQFAGIATAEELFNHPKHPYTRSLLQSTPQKSLDEEELHAVGGIAPSLVKLSRKGRRFAPQIPWIDAPEHEENPTLHEVVPSYYVRCICYKHFYFRDGEGGA